MDVADQEKACPVAKECNFSRTNNIVTVGNKVSMLQRDPMSI